MSGISEHIWNSILAARGAGKPLVMGIVNSTPDSFSDGGVFMDTRAAIGHALLLVEEGADIVDVGGESTRPGAEAVSEEEELRRVIPVIEGFRKHSSAPVSVDTRKAAVARAACEAGANMINDVSALLHDANMTGVVQSFGVPVVLMHMQGVPETMQNDPQYDDVVADVSGFLAARIAHCRAHGIERAVADPGFGFGKRLEHNLALLRRLDELQALGTPLLAGASRKRFIGEVTGLDTGERLGGSIAAALIAAMNGASIVRVHDVKDTVAALNILAAVLSTGERAHAV